MDRVNTAKPRTYTQQEKEVILRHQVSSRLQDVLNSSKPCVTTIVRDSHFFRGTSKMTCVD